jgi:REP element-mobilizing transposase RayT
VVVLARTDFRVVHASIQANHIHLLLEAESKLALARGMKAFQISAARRLDQVDLDGSGGRARGPVFPDRYHAEIVTTPTHARHTLSYVLDNWREHEEDRMPATRCWMLDRYSTAPSFAGWAERVDCSAESRHCTRGSLALVPR